MPPSRIEKILKLLPIVQLVAGVLVGAASAVAAVAITNNNRDHAIESNRLKNVEQDESIRQIIKDMQADKEVLIRVDENVKMLVNRK